MGKMNDVTMNNEAEILAVTTLGHIRQSMPGLPNDLRPTAETIIPGLAALAGEFDKALVGAGVDPDAVSAVQDRFRARLVELSAGAVKALQERINGMLRHMTPPQQDARVLVEYRARMAVVLTDGGALLSAYYDAAETRDDTTMVAIEQAPKWDKFFALSEDQREQGRRMRWGDVATALEAVEELRFHVIAVTQAVKQHINDRVYDDPLDVIDAR
jgi:hypothetical protein